jgi:hypothetical protein
MSPASSGRHGTAYGFLGMETSFGRRRRFSLGIEEELQILDGDRFGLVSRIADVLAELPRPHREGRVKEELLQSFLELAAGVTDLVGGRLGARRPAAACPGCGRTLRFVIAAAGTHPFSRYEEQEITPRARYWAFIQAVRWLGERQVGLRTHSRGPGVGRRRDRLFGTPLASTLPRASPQRHSVTPGASK